MRAFASLLVVGSFTCLLACSSSPTLFFSDAESGEEQQGGSGGGVRTDPKAENVGGSPLVGRAGANASGGQTGASGATNAQGGAAGNSGSSNANAGTSGGEAKAGATGNAGNGGSSAGQAGTSGQAGTGGSPVSLDLIDDFEDGNIDIIESGDREGKWFAFHDGSSGSLQSRIPDVAPARAGSKRAIWLSVRDYTTWGAGMACSLNEDKKFGKRAYDASRYRGFTFWARTNLDNLEIKVQAPDSSSSPIANLCGTDCSNHFLTKRVLSKAWTQYFVYFAELKRERNSGLPVTSVDTKRIYSLEWIVPAPTPECELWVDDVSFLN